MKKQLLAGVLAVAMAAVMVGIGSTSVSAERDSQTWSIMVHLSYANGDEYDLVVQSGVSTSQKADMLAECGRSHWQGTVVRYHCYPVAE